MGYIFLRPITGQQILCKLVPAKSFLSLFAESERYKSLPVFRPVSRSLSALLRSVKKLLAMAAAPLRRIVARELCIHQPNPRLKYSIYSLIDTLECGHTQEIYLFDGLRDLANAYTENAAIAARRHRCHPCASLLAKKKPQSVPLFAVAKTA